MLATEPKFTSLAPSGKFSDADVTRLEAEFLTHPQVDCPVKHYFGPGIYIREVFLPAGSYVIGHAHKAAHLCIMIAGRMDLINHDGTRTEVLAPKTFTASPGRKIAHIHDDVLFQNIWATDERDVETLEAMFLDKSAPPLLLAGPAIEADRADYAAAIAERGLDADTVTQIVLNEADMIAMPLGEYHFTFGPSPIHGRGTFASSQIEPNEIIGPARIGAMRTPLGRFVNHSANPNAAMTRHGDMINLVALASIAGCKGGANGDEITIDYRQALDLS